MSTLKKLAESLPEPVVNAIAGSYAASHLIAAKAKAEKEAAMQHLMETAPRPTPVMYGTDRDYLLHRLNLNYQGKNPGMADYVGVRKTGQWEETK